MSYCKRYSLDLVHVQSQGQNSLLNPAEMEQIIRCFDNFLSFLSVNVNNTRPFTKGFSQSLKPFEVGIYILVI